MKFVLAILSLAFMLESHAQQEMLNTMFWNNYTIFNPAATGLFYKHQANATFRDQWEGVNGAPQTWIANYNAKIDGIHGGLGANYIYEDISVFHTTRVNVNYSYHFKVGENGILSAGFSGGLLFNKYSFTPQSSVTTTTFNANAGLVYKNDRLNIGLSTTNLNQLDYNKSFYTPALHYYLCADYLFTLGERFDLKPQVLLRTDAVKFSCDLNVLAYYKKQFWLGVTYRTTDAICFMGGWDFPEKHGLGLVGISWRFLPE